MCSRTSNIDDHTNYIREKSIYSRGNKLHFNGIFICCMETDRTEKITHIHDIHVTHTGFEVAIRARRTRTVGGGGWYICDLYRKCTTSAEKIYALNILLEPLDLVKRLNDFHMLFGSIFSASFIYYAFLFHATWISKITYSAVEYPRASNSIRLSPGLWDARRFRLPHSHSKLKTNSH